MADNIQLITMVYSPVPYSPELGGDARFRFRVGFTDSLPSEYSYKIELSVFEELILTVEETFSTEGFTWNSDDNMYEKDDYEEIRITSEQVLSAFSGKVLKGNMSVDVTASESETPSSATARVCSGMQIDCIPPIIPDCDCCEEEFCKVDTGGCETSMEKCTTDESATSKSCSSGLCSTGSSYGSYSNYNSLVKRYYKGMFEFPGGLVSMPSVREGKLKLKATHLSDGYMELSIYHSSIRVMEIGYYGWHFNFNDYLLEDPEDHSILTFFNPTIGRMRYVYNEEDGTYSPYDEDFEVQLVMDEVAGLASLVFPDGSAVDYYIPEVKDENVPITYHLASKRDSKGRILVKYEDWQSIIFPAEITDFYGRVITGSYEQDSEQRTITFTDWLDRNYVYVFDLSPLRLVSYTDPLGNVMEFTYVDAEFLGPSGISYNDEELVTYDLSHNPWDRARVGSVTYPDGTTIEYEYDFTEGIHKKTINGEDEYIYEYNSDGQITAYTRPDGTVSTVTYNDDNKPLSITQYRCGSETKTHTYDENGNMLTSTDALGNVTTYEYEDENNPDKPTKIISPAPFNYETVYTYDPDTGDLLTVTDPLGRTTTNTYYTDEAREGLLYTKTDHLGRTTTYDYDEFRNIKWIKDYLDRYQYFWYDDLGRIHKETDIYDRTTRYTYDQYGNLIIIEDYEGKRTRFKYDSLRRRTESIDPEGRITLYTYDSRGRVICTTDSTGNTTKTEYDDYDRVIKETDTLGNSVQYEYDDYGNLICITDPMGRKTVFEIGSDISKKLTGMTDPMGRKTTWSCDSLCSISTTVLPDGKEIKHYYDALCQLNKVVYPDGSMVLYEYDEMGRRTAVTGAGWLYGEEVYGGKTYGSGTYGGFKYGEKILYGFNPANTVYYEYDAGNRLTKISYPDPGGSVIRKDINYQYDDGDRITKITDIAGYEQTYVYDDDYDGRVSSVTKHNKTVTYHYDDDNYGRLDYFTLPNGIKKEFIFNEDDEFTGMKYTKNSGTTILYQFDYEYDSDTGNIIKQTITKPDGTQTVNNYNYDSLNRLVSVMKNGQKQTWYDFDAMGNRLRKTVQNLSNDGNSGGAVSLIENYTYNTGDELICMNGTRFKYDLYGNMTEKNDPVEGKTQYTYNSAGRLSKILFPDNTESKYFYDHRGFRIKKIDKTNRTTFYYWDKAQIPNAINETDENGNITNILFSGVGFKSAYNNNEWRFFITDHLGSVIALSNENGNITDQYEYDEYGNPVSTSGTSYNPYRYTGQDYDTETGLTYLRARYYNISLGIFTSRDLYYNSKVSSYLYVKNNPIKLIDPTGFFDYSINIVEYDLWDLLTLESELEDCIINAAFRGTYEISARPLCPQTNLPCTDKMVHCATNCRVVWCIIDFVGEVSADIAAPLVSLLGGAVLESSQAIYYGALLKFDRISFEDSIMDTAANYTGTQIAIKEFHEGKGKNCFKDCCCWLTH